MSEKKKEKEKHLANCLMQTGAFQAKDCLGIAIGVWYMVRHGHALSHFHSLSVKAMSLQLHTAMSL